VGDNSAERSTAFDSPQFVEIIGSKQAVKDGDSLCAGELEGVGSTEDRAVAATD
jgi:hypothetical protein